MFHIISKHALEMFKIKNVLLVKRKEETSQYKLF